MRMRSRMRERTRMLTRTRSPRVCPRPRTPQRRPPKPRLPPKRPRRISCREPSRFCGENQSRGKIKRTIKRHCFATHNRSINTSIVTSRPPIHISPQKQATWITCGQPVGILVRDIVEKKMCLIGDFSLERSAEVLHSYSRSSRHVSPANVRPQKPYRALRATPIQGGNVPGSTSLEPPPVAPAVRPRRREEGQKGAGSPACNSLIRGRREREALQGDEGAIPNVTPLPNGGKHLGHQEGVALRGAALGRWPREAASEVVGSNPRRSRGLRHEGLDEASRRDAGARKLAAVTGSVARRGAERQRSSPSLGVRLLARLSRRLETGAGPLLREGPLRGNAKRWESAGLLAPAAHSPRALGFMRKHEAKVARRKRMEATSCGARFERSIGWHARVSFVVLQKS